MNKSRVFFVAAEASGDLLAREVIEEIRVKSTDTEIFGIGGGEMAAAGIDSPIDIAPLSVLGFLEGIKAYRKVVELADAATDEILAARPDVVVLVDSWGFMLRVAQRVRLRDPSIKIVKLIGPQVWATRPGRAKTLAATVDHLLCMHDMEVPYYAPHDMKTTVIGNPALSRSNKGNGEAFRSSIGLSGEDKMLLVLPGSRTSEIRRVAPALVDTAYRLHKSLPELKIVFAPSANVREAFQRSFPNLHEWAIVSTDATVRYDAMAAADVALACSGTVTSELAMQGTPFAVAYKTGWITWALARGLLYQKTHVTLLNIVSDDQEIVPEFIQTRQKPVLIHDKLLHWLTNEDALCAQKQSQAEALSRMVQKGRAAADIAADAILEEARSRATGLLA